MVQINVNYRRKNSMQFFIFLNIYNQYYGSLDLLTIITSPLRNVFSCSLTWKQHTIKRCTTEQKCKLNVSDVKLIRSISTILKMILTCNFHDAFAYSLTLWDMPSCNSSSFCSVGSAAADAALIHALIHANNKLRTPSKDGECHID